MHQPGRAAKSIDLMTMPLFSSSSADGSNIDPALAELVQFSTKALLFKARRQTRTPEEPCPPNMTSLKLGKPSTPVASYPSEVHHELHHNELHHHYDAGHASPLMPLRERDTKVLVELFTHDSIEPIEADIQKNLLWRCPEPCWEDDPFDFLREFL